MKKVDILMVCYKHEDLTRKAIETLVSNTDKGTYRLHILDNTPEQTTGDLLLELGKQGNLLDGIGYLYYHFNNVGWIKAIHQVYPKIEGDYFLTTHNDVEFEKDWLPKMLDQFIDDKVAAVGPTVDFVLGYQSVNYDMPGLVGEDSNFIVGLFCLFSKKAVDKLIRKDGFFMDEQFGLGDKEEHDYALRFHDMGYRYRIARKVFIKHHGEKGFADVLGGKDKFHEYQHAQHQKLIAKWGEDRFKKLWDIDPKKRLSTVIGLPLVTDYSGHCDFWLSLAMMHKPGIIHYGVTKRTIIHEARNSLVQSALDADATHVLFIDDDMILPSDGFVRLLEADKDIICGLAFQRLAPHKPCILNKIGNELIPIQAINKGLIEIDACGSAFTLIKTKVFKKMKYPWYVWGDTSLGLRMDAIHTFGEDSSFSLRAKQRYGFEVWCDTDMIIDHIGEAQRVNEKTFLSYMEFLETQKNKSSLKAI